MGQERSAGTNTNRQNSTIRNREKQVYIEGSAARQLQGAPERVQRTGKQTLRTSAKSQHFNMGYMLVLVAAMTVVCTVLIGYVNLQADITSRIEHISSMESELNELKLSNDELYTGIISAVDLEEIKRIAIQELGMKYAKEGQVITYTGEGSDYVRQYSDIPE